MKITKKQLQQIIKEELSEEFGNQGGLASAARKKHKKEIRKLLSSIMKKGISGADAGDRQWEQAYWTPEMMLDFLATLRTELDQYGEIKYSMLNGD